MKKILLALSFLMASLLSVEAEVLTDSLFVWERKTVGKTARPKVGLVLAGGGAKGAAHIGVLQYLDELDIPVDYVVGTSMGSIIGGMYALGYEPSHMSDIIKSLDWPFYMGNSVGRREMSATQKKALETYLVSIPFGTRKEELQKFVSTGSNEKYLLSSGEIVNSENGSRLLNTLPAGLIDGNNLVNLFNDLSIGYQDSLDFADLPIPYACVTTDMLDGSQRVLRNGILPLAMRSSMAIPVVFAPVEYEGHLLVDGGMVNNFPTDICRDMGADIIIGVELTKGFKADQSKINSMPGMLGQLMAIVTSGHNASNRQICDVYIRPDVSGYGTMSFDSKSIDTLVMRGYDEAVKYCEELAAIKEYVEANGPVHKTLHAKPAKYLNDTSIVVSKVNVNTIDNRYSRWLLRKWGIDVGKVYTADEIHSTLDKMKGTGRFKSLTYNVRPDDNNEGGYGLVINCEENSPHRLYFGLRGDTEEAVAVGVRLGINENRMSGVRASLNGKLSYNPEVELKGTLSLLSLFDVNLSYKYRLVHSHPVFDEYMTFYSKHSTNLFRFYVSEYYSRSFISALGVEYETHRFDNFSQVQVNQMDSLARNAAVFGDLRFDNLDRKSFATSGVKARVQGKYRFSSKADVNFQSQSYNDRKKNAELYGYVEGYITPDEGRFTLIPSLYHRSLSSSETHFYQRNMFGGMMEGRYYDCQMPFAGITGIQASSFKHCTVARLDMRTRLADKFYVTAIANYLTSADSFQEYFDKSTGLSNYGFALKGSYDSKFGPISVDVHWSDISHRWGAYLSVGYDF